MTLNILALETSSSVCGVALLSRSEFAVVVKAMDHDARGEHAERLLPMVDQLLAQAGIGRQQLTAVAFGQGPGGFTGLRVACGVAQGMAFALNIPVLPIGSLLAVAARDHVASRHDALPIVVAQDARMGEVYLAAYQHRSAGGGRAWQELQPPILMHSEHVGRWLTEAAADWGMSGDRVATIRLVGDALEAYPAIRQLATDMPSLEVGPAVRPDAETIARLALQNWDTVGGIAPDLAAPLYVRDKVAYTTLEREGGSGGNPRAPEPAMSVHPMTPNDLDQVAAIEQRVQSFPWTRRNFEDGLLAGYAAWVVRESGRVVGFCMTMFAPDVAHILVIAVAPEHQGKGIGALLLAQSEREARARDLPSLILEVRPTNTKALAFYRAQGFSLLAMRKAYYPAQHGKREDACVMQKRLKSNPEVAAPQSQRGIGDESTKDQT